MSMPSCYKKRGGFRGGATHIHKRKLSSEPHVKKRYKLGNHLFHTPDFDKGKTESRLLNQKRWWVSLDFFLNFPIKRCIIFATMPKYLDGQESSKELANLETFSY
jgi:hypothetical protein